MPIAMPELIISTLMSLTGKNIYAGRYEHAVFLCMFLLRNIIITAPLRDP